MDLPKYYCIFHPVTRGLQGNRLGSDEQEIILLLYVLLDTSDNTIITIKHYLVAPDSCDINGNALPEAYSNEVARPLHVALSQFDEYLVSLHINTKTDFQLITDGQSPLRQCLHPEACKKNIVLPAYYNQFHDLRKHVCSFYYVSNHQQLTCPDDFLNCMSMTLSKHSLMTCLDETGSEEVMNFMKPYVSETQKIVSVVQRLIHDGHRFVTAETVNLDFEARVYLKHEKVDSNCVVQIRGFPWLSTEQDIVNLFRGLNIEKGGVAISLSEYGRRNGEGFVLFVNEEHRNMAIMRHLHRIHRRYIEVTKATGEDFINIAGGTNDVVRAFLTKRARVIIKMRGIPFKCTPKHVVDFFQAGTVNSCNVVDGEEGVLFHRNSNGKLTGDAFVLLEDEEDAAKALSKHKQLIGRRYIELFRVSASEVQQLFNRDIRPQHSITRATRKNCVLLKGLPYETLVDNIIDFLDESASNVVRHGVHMIYNFDGQPSGQAFVQMNSEQNAALAAQLTHNRCLVIHNNHNIHYQIQGFQCCSEDINHVLNGRFPLTEPSHPVGKTVFSPGMLPPQLPPSQLGRHISQPLVQVQYPTSQHATIVNRTSAIQSMSGLTYPNIHTQSLTPAISISTPFSPHTNSWASIVSSLPSMLYTSSPNHLHYQVPPLLTHTHIPHPTGAQQRHFLFSMPTMLNPEHMLPPSISAVPDVRQDNMLKRRWEQAFQY